MKHPRRVGLAINDKDMKFIKKLLKKNPIIFEGSIRDTDDCIVQITNIRKYDDYWKYTCDKKFVYEIDIKVKKIISIDILTFITILDIKIVE